MRLTSLETFPLFPDWVFKGKLELDEPSRQKIINEIQRTPTEKKHFGTISKPNTLGPVAGSLIKLVGNMFINEVTGYFNLSNELKNRIQLCGYQYTTVNPNCKTDISITTRRWYKAVLKVSGDGISSNPHFTMLNEKMHTTPNAIQGWDYHQELKEMEVLFFPAHIPFDLTVNQSKSPCVFLSVEIHTSPQYKSGE